jgi:hypothetical protein
LAPIHDFIGIGVHDDEAAVELAIAFPFDRTAVEEDRKMDASARQDRDLALLVGSPVGLLPLRPKGIEVVDREEADLELAARPGAVEAREWSLLRGDTAAEEEQGE